MIERSLSCLGPSGFHRLAYSEWPGPTGAPTLLCVHGLTRNGRDFDALGEALCDRYRVICPDMPGRGRSDNLTNAADYNTALYLTDLVALIARLDVERIDWLGTSMGGVLGMLIAARPGNPIRRLALNDVGAVVVKTGLERIATYIGLDPSFSTLEAMERAVRVSLASFGPMTDAQVRSMTEISARRRPDGSYGFAYDPHIADAMKAGPIDDVNLWPVWDAIRCPVLALRGADSDILPRDVAEAMTQRGPKAQLVEFPGVGHAPLLLNGDQIAPIREFLLA